MLATLFSGAESLHSGRRESAGVQSSSSSESAPSFLVFSVADSATASLLACSVVGSAVASPQPSPMHSGLGSSEPSFSSVLPPFCEAIHAESVSAGYSSCAKAEQTIPEKMMAVNTLNNFMPLNLGKKKGVKGAMIENSPFFRIFFLQHVGATFLKTNLLNYLL